MIVVGIIGILAAIAIPNYIRYQLRTKTTEAKAIMGGIRIAQGTFRAEFDNYVAAGPNPTVLPGSTKGSWEETPCPPTCTRDAIDQCSTFACFGFAPRSPVYYQYETRTVIADVGQPAEFSAGCRSDLDEDGTFGSFTLRSTNEQGSQVSTVNDGLSSCANAPIPAHELFDCQPNTY